MSAKFVVTVDKDIEEIVPMFLDNRQKDIESLKHHIQADELKEIEVIAHKLAGNAGSYGFADLGKIGAALEQACKDQDIETIKIKYQEFCDYMTNVEVEFIWN